MHNILRFTVPYTEISYIKCQSQIAHSAPKNLCSQTPPVTLSLSQIIELDEEAEDEPRLFTRTNKKQYKKDRLIYALRAYINKSIFEKFLLGKLFQLLIKKFPRIIYNCIL